MRHHVEAIFQKIRSIARAASWVEPAAILATISYRSVSTHFGAES
jgi:hypothetical protein